MSKITRLAVSQKPLNQQKRKTSSSKLHIFTCVLYKSSIDIKPLSLTLHGVNTHFIYHPSNKGPNDHSFIEKFYFLNCQYSNKHISKMTRIGYVSTHPMSKITRLAVSQKPLNQQKRKTSSSKLHIFTPFCKFLGQNSKYPSLQKWGNLFDIWAIGT